MTVWRMQGGEKGQRQCRESDSTAEESVRERKEKNEKDEAFSHSEATRRTAATFA